MNRLQLIATPVHFFELTGTKEELETMQHIRLWDDQLFMPQTWPSCKLSLSEYSQFIAKHQLPIRITEIEIQGRVIRGAVGFHPEQSDNSYNVAARLWSLESERGKDPESYKFEIDLLSHVYRWAVNYAKSTMCHDGSTIVATVPDWAPLQNAALRQEFNVEPVTLIDDDGNTINRYHIS